MQINNFKYDYREYLENFISKTIPRELWSNYDSIVSAIKIGFLEGMKFERELRKNKKKTP